MNIPKPLESDLSIKERLDTHEYEYFLDLFDEDNQERVLRTFAKLGGGAASSIFCMRRKKGSKDDWTLKYEPPLKENIE